jgi:phosphoribosylaminoimidazolecarboxamide formyltransferase/IMP cyclohydrolase
MNDQIRIKSALISVYSKDGIEEIAHKLASQGVKIYSTGGTFDFLVEKGIHAIPIESVTSYPSILGGRVKTLHPKVFGGILWRRNQLTDVGDVEKYEIPSIDLVIVDLYPFEHTVETTNQEDEIIEKIDIGGISLIRAAAKNYAHVVVIPSAGQYADLAEILEKKSGITTLDDRRKLAAFAFSVSSHYDTQIFQYFNRKESIPAFRQSYRYRYPMRYGENPHQPAAFYGDLEAVFTQLHGKELSYNNLVDVDAAISLIGEFTEPTVAIIKHTNPCGVASRSTLLQAYNDALACDPVSAFGGIIIANGIVDNQFAEELNKLFFEILIADGFENEAMECLKSKKNRILLQKNSFDFLPRQYKTVLNGVLEQEKDLKTESKDDFTVVTAVKPSEEDMEELVFANKMVKHLKSNTIVLSKNRQLIGCGMGQTSRVDALRQAILKARAFGFDTRGAVMASDAFFPFADSVEIAFEAGIRTVIQPGGSVRDNDSITFCNDHEMSMVFTGTRHFKH